MFCASVNVNSHESQMSNADVTQIQQNSVLRNNFVIIKRESARNEQLMAICDDFMISASSKYQLEVSRQI